MLRFRVGDQIPSRTRFCRVRAAAGPGLPR